MVYPGPMERLLGKPLEHLNERYDSQLLFTQMNLARHCLLASK